MFEIAEAIPKKGRFSKLSEALEEPLAVRELWISFGEWEIHDLPEEVLKFDNLELLQLRKLPDQWAAPAGLSALKKLRGIGMAAAGDRLFIPDIIKAMSFSTMELWDCHPRELMNFRDVERLSIVVGDPMHMEEVIPHLGNLRGLKLWGSHLKDGVLPDNISQLAALEDLAFISCGIRELPSSFADLVNLKRLCFAGLPMDNFPEVVCKLRNLEELDYQQHSNTLPDALADLTKLRVADFSHGFNRGTLDAGDAYEEHYFKPIPAILAKLRSLERLDVSACGVEALSWTAGAPALKSISFNWSGVEDLTPLTTIPTLEEIDAENSGKLKDISPLKQLPKLRRLNLRSSYCLKELKDIGGFESLEQLDIKGVDDIENIEEVFSLGSLKTLIADAETMERWEQRQKLAKLPPPEEIMRRLSAADLATVSEAMDDLCERALFHSTRESNGLLNLFGVAGDEVGKIEMVALPLLDAAFDKFGPELSEELLTKLVRVSFQDVGDNFLICRAALDMIVERELLAAQNTVVQEVWPHALRYYDYGHRHWEGTMHDNFIDEVFPGFLAEPLSHLLDDPHSDALNNDGGDGMEALYAVAYSNDPDEESFSRLWESLTSYLKKMRDYDFGDEAALLDELRKTGNRELLLKLDQRSASETDREGLRADLQGKDVGAFERAAQRLADLDERQWEGLRDIYGKAFGREDIPLSAEAAARAFVVLCTHDWQDESGRLLDLVLEHDLEGGLARLLAAPQDAEVRGRIADKLRSKVLYSYPQVAPVSAEVRARLESMRKAYCALQGEDEAQALIDELLTVLRWRLGNHDLSFVEKFSYFDEFEAVPKDRQGQIPFLINLNLETALECEQFDELEVILPRLKKLALPPYDLERMLALAVVGPVRARSARGVNLVVEMLPEEITFDVLAYNLACYYALEGDRENLLDMTARAVRLGKDKRQFLADEDFRPYLEDEDFLAALEE